MLDELIDYAHNELVAYAGMILILSAFVLETRGVLQSKECPLGADGVWIWSLAVRAIS